MSGNMESKIVAELELYVEKEHTTKFHDPDINGNTVTTHYYLPSTKQFEKIKLLLTSEDIDNLIDIIFEKLVMKFQTKKGMKE